MEALFAFAAAVITLRLAGLLLARRRATGRPELLAWGAAVLCFSVASGALAWGAAWGWNAAAFRVYYLFGGMLTAALLGVGSLLLVGRRWAAPVGLAYAGLATGLVLAVPLTAAVGGQAIPGAGEHLEFVPVRLAAMLGNVLGTVAVVAVAAATLRRRPLGNALIVAGVAVAALGSWLFGIGVVGTAASLLLAAVLLYAGFVARPRVRGAGMGALRPAPHGEPESADHDDRQDFEDEPAGTAVRE